jgi:hypothetical protein
MDGLILIRSVTLSNHIARTQQPEGVVASYHRALWGVAEIALSHLRKSESYKQPALVEGIEERSSTRLAFQEYQRRSQNIIKNSIYL